MPAPLTRATLDAALSAATRQREDAVVALACPAHPADGCRVLYAGWGVVDVLCFTCGHVVASLALQP